MADRKSANSLFTEIKMELRLTFAGTLDVFKILSPTGERKPNSSLARVQEDQRRILKMWLSNDNNTLEDKLSLELIHLLESRIAKPEPPNGGEACTRCCTKC